MTPPLHSPRGKALARHLATYLGYTTAINQTCDHIARLSDRLQRYELIATNDRSLTPTELTLVESAEREISNLVANLPHTDHGPITVRCDGDPRGRVVRVIVPGVPHDGNTWGLGGEFEV